MLMQMGPEIVIPVYSGTMALNYVVYEHSVTGDATTPPVPMYVGVCQAADLFRPQDAFKNSEWLKVLGPNRPMLLAILAIGDSYHEAFNFARAHIAAMPVKPRCNEIGYTVVSKSRAIVCSNGIAIRRSLRRPVRSTCRNQQFRSI